MTDTAAATPGTLAGFEDAHRARTLAENAGLTGAEYDRCYPRGSREQEWIRAVEDFARTGGIVSRTVADCLYEHRTDPIRFLRYYPNALPVGYLTPDVREINRQHEREMVDARKRGRSAMGEAQ